MGIRRSAGSSDKERRDILKFGLGFAAVSAAYASGIGIAQAVQKAKKEDVAYQETSNGDQNCANCRFWEEGGGCTVVEGDIRAEAWCAIWAA